MTENLILIPARSGSTRVIDKNIRMLGDKPLVGHVVSAAVQSGAGRVVVTTNSEKIAAVARDFGAETPFLRPPGLSGAGASSISAIIHALKWLSGNDGWMPNVIAFCPPTNPFTRPETIRGIIETLSDDADAVSMVTMAEPWTHPFKIVATDENGWLRNGVIPLNGKTINDIERSQDWPRVHAGSPACRASKFSFFERMFDADLMTLKSKTYDVDACRGYAIGKIESFDIDDEADFILAEKMYGVLDRIL